MKIIPENHWLLTGGLIFCLLLGIVTFSSLIRTEYALQFEIWTWGFMAILVWYLMLSLAVVGLLYGFVVTIMASLLYSLFTHDPDFHWFPRWIVGTRALNTGYRKDVAECL